MKIIWSILLTGIVLRVFLVFSTFHPDVSAFDLAGKIVSSGNILNLYDFSSDLAVFNYPPLIYWFHGLFRFLIPIQGYGFVKLPYLIFDILIALLFLKFFSTTKMGKLAVALWMFNPVNLYASYMMGQFDIIPTFFTIWSLYLITKKRLMFAALALGGGIAFKLYPIFLLLPLLVLGKNWLERFKLLILAIAPYILSILPYLSSSSFRSTALFASQNSKSLYANIAVSGGETLLLFPLSLVFFYIIIWQKKEEPENLLGLFLIPLLLFYIFTHFHPQWFIWVTPFLIINLVKEKFKNLTPVLIVLVSYIGSLFFFDSSLTIGLFVPLFPVLENIGSIWDILHVSLDINLSRSILQTIFAAGCLYLVYDFSKKRITT